jgi:rare lipoprotein A
MIENQQEIERSPSKCAAPKGLLTFVTLLMIVNLCLAQKAETGLASFYSDSFEGKKTASGELYRSSKLTAAHRTLAFGTRVRVTNLSNKKSVVVTINDRGPFVKERIVDLSRAAAAKLDFMDKGVTRVQVEVVGKP